MNDTLPDKVKAAIILFFSILNEKQKRLYAGLESLKLGHGGDKIISELIGIDVHTVSKGRKELISGKIDNERIRCKGGGRHRVKKNPEIIIKLKKLMEDETAGDPATGLKWTKKTTQKISDEFESIGIKISKNTVGKMLKELDFSLRVN